MAALAIAFGLILILVAVSTVAGVVKDGSPFRREWWT